MAAAASGLRSWMTLFAAAVAMLVLGGVYAYGVFLPEFMREFGWDRSTAALPQSVQLFVYAIGMGVGGGLQDRTSPTLVAFVGSVVFAVGVCLAALTSSLLGLALTLGLVAGLGFGFVYVSAVTAVLKSFPGRRGLAAGVVVGAYGIGTFAWAPAAQALLDAGTSWQSILLGYGLTTMLVLGLLSAGIRAPRRRAAEELAPVEAEGADFSAALRTGTFWIVFAAYTLVTTAGLMWLAHFKAYGLSRGMSPAQAAFLVSLTAIGSGLGRVLRGYASDHVGRFPVLVGASVLGAVLFVALGLGMPHAGVSAAAALSGFAFGAWLALYGPTSTDLFGMRAAGSIYGALYLSYGLGGIAGPVLGGAVADATGGYEVALFAMAGACAAGALLFGAAALARPPQHPHPPALEEEVPFGVAPPPAARSRA